MGSHLVITGAVLVPLAIIVAYTDVRYRRIPNAVALAALGVGLCVNTADAGYQGLLASLGGFAFAFALMLLLHVFGAMGAGDVKLFAAIGSIVGARMVLPTFAVVLVTGFVMALVLMFRAGVARQTVAGVVQFFACIFMGWERPQFAVPEDRRRTVPYGVAITLGSLISLVAFRA